MKNKFMNENEVAEFTAWYNRNVPMSRLDEILNRSYIMEWNPYADNWDSVLVFMYGDYTFDIAKCDDYIDVLYTHIGNIESDSKSLCYDESLYEIVKSIIEWVDGVEESNIVNTYGI